MARPITKKSDLLDAALALFMKNGIKGTTTRDIANRAGISEGTIYRHFASKRELAESIFEENVDYFWNFLKPYLRKTKTPEELVTSFVRGIFEFSRREQRRYSFISTAHQTELKKLSRDKMKPNQVLIRILKLGQMQGKFRNLDPHLAGAMLIGLITQTIFYMKSGRISVEYNCVVEEVAQACIKIMQIEPL